MLSDIEYCQKVKDWITSVENENEEDICPKLLWELILLRVRGETIKFSTLKKKLRENIINDLEQRISNLEAKLQTDVNNNGEVEKNLKNAKNELETHIAQKTKGAMIRSRTKWVEEGEKSTKYFFNLEKRNHASKNVIRLRLADNSIITDQNEILKEEKKFYDKLLTTEITSDR